MQPEPEYLIGKHQNNLYLAAYSVLQNPQMHRMLFR